MGIREKIGAELRALRMEKELTTGELAELCGLTHTNIVKIEDGRYNVRLDTVDVIARALGAELLIAKRDE